MPEHALMHFPITPFWHRQVALILGYLIAPTAVKIWFGRNIDTPVVNGDQIRLKACNGWRPLLLWHIDPIVRRPDRMTGRQGIGFNLDRLQLRGVRSRPVTPTKQREESQTGARGKRAIFLIHCLD